MKHPEPDWIHGPHFQDGPMPHGAPPFDSDEPDELAEDSSEFIAIRRIELLGRLHHMAFRSLFQDVGLPPAQAGALRTVIRHPGLSQRELADQLHIQRATATVMLQKMEKAGYIDRRPDQDDQRISRIYPTEAARATEAENQKTVNDYFARCFSGITAGDFAAMERAMTRLAENLRTILQEHPDPMNKE